MAWMFAATEQDLTVGMHQHIHFAPTPAGPVPTPFYPHPAIGQIRDNLCGSVKIDGRKAAKTGAKTKILLPPHLPLLGPLSHGTPKEGTGVQQVWMGVGIGLHPFGGIGFFVLEGKPAAAMLSNCLGCWCTSPGFDMMLPLVGMDFVMVPTRAATVYYGPAPLAMDLFVLLLSLIRDLFDYILGKVPDCFLKDVLSDAFDSVMVGLEVATDAIEQGKPLSEAIALGTKAAAYTFVDKSIGRAVELATGIAGSLGVDVPESWSALAEDALMERADELAGGALSEGEAAIADRDTRFTEATAENPLASLTDPMEVVAAKANEAAWADYEAQQGAIEGGGAGEEEGASAGETPLSPEQQTAQAWAVLEARDEQDAAREELENGAAGAIDDAAGEGGGDTSWEEEAVDCSQEAIEAGGSEREEACDGVAQADPAATAPAPNPGPAAPNNPSPPPIDYQYMEADQPNDADQEREPHEIIAIAIHFTSALLLVPPRPGSAYPAPRRSPDLDVHYPDEPVEFDPFDPATVAKLLWLYTGKRPPHYLIARDGRIFCLRAENLIANHTGAGTIHINGKTYTGAQSSPNWLDKHDIGIELCGITDYENMYFAFGPWKTAGGYRLYSREEFHDRYWWWVDEHAQQNHEYFTNAQYASLSSLIRYLTATYPIPFDREHIFGHEEFANEPRRMKDKAGGGEVEVPKVDPGINFDWSAIVDSSGNRLPPTARDRPGAYLP